MPNPKAPGGIFAKCSRRRCPKIGPSVRVAVAVQLARCAFPSCEGVPLRIRPSNPYIAAQIFVETKGTLRSVRGTADKHHFAGEMAQIFHSIGPRVAPHTASNWN